MENQLGVILKRAIRCKLQKLLKPLGDEDPEAENSDESQSESPLVQAYDFNLFKYIDRQESREKGFVKLVTQHT